MFSSDAVHDIHENFPLRSHLYPPSYELPASKVSQKAFSLAHILQFPTRKSNGTPLRKGHARCMTVGRCASSPCRHRSCTEAGHGITTRTTLRVSNIAKDPPAYAMLGFRWLRRGAYASAYRVWSAPRPPAGWTALSPATQSPGPPAAAATA